MGKRFYLQTINALLFSSILFYVYGKEAWQSNIVWIILMIVSCICAPSIDIMSKYRRQDIFKVIVLNILLAYCLIGNHLFVYPLDKQASLLSVLFFILFSISCSPMVFAVLSIPQKKFFSKIQETKRNQSRMHLLVYFLIPIVVGLIAMYALNPCIVSYDAYYVIAQAKGLEPIQEYIGVPYILWYRFLLSLIDSISFLCIVQIMLYALIMGFFLFFIETLFNIKIVFLAISFLLFSLLPNNIMMLVTLSKDVYYSLFLCLMLFSLFMMEKAGYVRYYVLFGLSSFLIWSIRPSGVLVIVIVALLGIFFIRNIRNMVLTVVVSIIISVLFNGIIVKVSGAEKTPKGMKYIALYQDILGVYYSGGVLSEDALTLVKTGVADIPDFINEYTPYWAYYENYYQKIDDVTVPFFIACYMDTLIKNPTIMFKAILCRLDMMWDIRPGIDAKETWQWYTSSSGGIWKHLVNSREENKLTRILDSIGEKSKAYPFKDVIWRVGIWNIFLLFLLFGIKEKREKLIVLPLIGFLIAYAASLGWSHYRYYWADELLVFMNLICISAQIAVKGTTKCTQKGYSDIDE